MAFFIVYHIIPGIVHGIGKVIAAMMTPNLQSSYRQLLKKWGIHNNGIWLNANFYSGG